MVADRPGVSFSVDVPQEMLQGMTSGGRIAPRISRNEALQVPAVLRSRNLIAGTLGSLPHTVHGPDRREVETTYLLGGNIDPDLPNSVMLAQTYEDLLFEGIAWWRVLSFGWHGYPVTASLVPVGSVHVAQTGALLPSQQGITPDQPFPANGQVYIDGYPVSDREVIRFDSPNPPLLRHAARAIRTCLTLDQAASNYADTPMPLSLFTPKEDTDPGSEADIEAMLNAWEAARSVRSTAYVGAALEYEAIGWTAQDIQLADSRQHAVLEIARAAGIDPEDLGVSTTSRTYQNAEQRRQDLIDFTLGAYVSAMQDRLSMRDVLPRGYKAKVKFEGFLRSDTLTRMKTYEIGRRVGAYNDERIADLEDIPSARVSTPSMPQQVRDIQNTPVPPPSTQQGADVPAASFTTDTDSVRVQFTAPEVAAAFRVDVTKRTISGLAVPWGKYARNKAGTWLFHRGSLYWANDIGRVKMNRDHDHGHMQMIGRAVRLDDQAIGLDTSFKIARGEDGDKALFSAEDGVSDGLSIEIEDIEYDDSPTVAAQHPGVRVVRRARLTGVALTAEPAFDDARVSGVTLSKEKGTSMTATVDEQKKPDDSFDFDGYMKDLGAKMVESHKDLTEQFAATFGEGLSAGIKTALEDLPHPQSGPESVKAARFQVTYEPPVYAFAGTGFSLVRDAYHAYHQRDRDAAERLRKYEQQTQEMAKLATAALEQARFTPQSTTTAAAIIPPGYRPDLYVSELLKGRPLVNACARGSIDNATPFVVPVFGSGGSTADHVEGTNPTDGSLTLTTKTVSPGGISGRLTLTREIVDSSNPAIDQIALLAMREAYSQQTEGKVYTLLNGASGAGGTITTGLVPSGAQAATFVGTTGTPPALIGGIRSQLAGYPFARFASPSSALMGQNATKILATAADSTGRPIFPSVGAMNTTGLANAVDQAWSVDGLNFQPAWAMTGTAAGDTQIAIWNRNDFWVWESPLLSFRYEEKVGPANIELNVFGYFATALIRPVGLSGIRIT
jgi:phage head maturation protease